MSYKYDALADSVLLRELQAGLEVCRGQGDELRRNHLERYEVHSLFIAEAENIVSNARKDFNLDTRQIEAENIYNDFFFKQSPEEKSSYLIAGADKYNNNALITMLPLIIRGHEEEEFVHHVIKSILCPIAAPQTPVAYMTLYDRLVLSAYNMDIAVKMIEQDILKPKMPSIILKNTTISCAKTFGENIKLIAAMAHPYCKKFMEVNNFSFTNTQQANFPDMSFE